MHTASPTGLSPGRSCPLSYRYSPAVFNRAAEVLADTIYVVGGLYGNLPALETIFALAAQEPVAPRLVFNGDFNWFNCDAAGFEAINVQVLRHVALRGNVETELASDDAEAGCGCAYPDSVGDAEVQRSNDILHTLRACAAHFPALRAQLGALPMHAVVQVGDLRAAIVHGDAQSLAGWGFSQDALDAPQNAAQIERAFEAAQVDLFASSHTCLPVARQFVIRKRQCAVINNGAAGMPNFPAMPCGLITRISRHASAHPAVYGFSQRGVHIDAIPVYYDQSRWIKSFLANWPPGSAGNESYFKRIIEGPQYGLAVAAPQCAATVL